ncbi:MAG: hypothetical protein P1V97_27040 [Planctomycetota bacterium]|nr:hypothetical protein [Planctomycetota bacterium]
MRFLLWPLVLIIGVTSAAFAETVDDTHRMSREEREAKECLIGVKGLAIFGRVDRDRGEENRREVAIGSALFIERAFIPGILEIELSVGWAEVIDADNDKSVKIYPMDLTFKMPFHVNSRINPYLGLGFGLTIEDSEEGTEEEFGITSVVGTYIWWDEQIGLDLELSYGAFPGRGVKHEFILAFGPVIHF